MNYKPKEIALWLIEHRLLTLVIALSLLGGLLPGLATIKSETDYRIFFDQSNPNLIAHNFIESEYTSSDNISVLVSVPEGSAGDLFQAHSLEALLNLTNQAWQVPYAVRVDSLTNYQHIYALQDDVIIADLISEDDISSKQPRLEEMRSVALARPELVNQIVSRDARTTAVTVTLKLPSNQEEANLAVIESTNAVKVLVTEFEEQYPQLEFHIVGQSAVVAAFNDMMQHDVKTLFPIMLLVAFILLYLLLNSVFATLLTLGVAICSLMATFGLAGYLGIALNQVNAVTPMIILIIAVCDCVHLLLRYLSERSDGNTPENSLICAIQTNLTPIFLTSLTTIIGFASLNFGDSPPFRSLGTLSAIGVAFAFIFALLLCPMIVNVKTRGRPRVVRAFSPLLVKIHQLVVFRPKAVLFWGMFPCLILIYLAFENEVNDHTIGYFQSNVPIHIASDLLQERLAGFDRISYSFETSADSGINDPNYLRDVAKFVDWARSQPEVSSVASYTDTLRHLNQVMNNDDPSYYVVPATQEEAAQFQLMYELSLPYGLDLNHQINMRKSALKVMVIFRANSSDQIIEMEQRAQRWMQANMPHLATQGAGISLLFAYLGTDNITSMITGTIIAILLIGFILLMVFRSWRIGLLSLLPNACPAFMALGIWAVCIGEVNMAVAGILTITLGIVVDDTVHFISRYLELLKDDQLTSSDALLRSFHHVGSAVVTTSIVLTAGFAVLAMSDFNVNAYMGAMVAITIALAVLFDLFILPAILFLLPRKSSVNNFYNTP